jgi:exopolyphosphatase/guanosine-5'-triphosphate,3'-diphosphate pyrophosphatase
MKTSQVTAIDLGSNSYRVLQFDCNTKKTIGEFETTVGLADGLQKSGKISDEAIKRVVDAIAKSIEKLNFDPTKAVAVTTHAMRKASNAKEVLQSLKQKTQISFEIIDSTTEATLTLLAMKEALKRENLASNSFFLLDIGGGSTELIYATKTKQKIKSFSFGIVTLAQTAQKKQKLQEFEKEIKSFIASCDIEENTLFVSTAGTPTTLAALSQGLNYQTYDKNIVNGTILKKNEILERKEYLSRLSKEELIFEVGSGRDDYIDTGISIFLLFFEALKKESTVVFDDGLREGVALKSCMVK